MSLADKQILKTQAEEERGENARLSIFVGATAIGDMLRTTLGPKGMDKILLRMNAPHNRGFSVTNDGATIMKSIGVDNPAAKILSNVAQTQDNEVGDGTTSVVVLAAELLHQAEKLIAHGLHPQTIIGGWQAAVDVAESVLEQSSFSLYLNSGENSKNTCANKNINKNECYFYQKTNNFNSDQNDPQNSDKNNNQNINYNISNINANSCSKNIDICNQNCGIITQNINKNSNINNICSNNNDIYNNFSDDFIQKLKDLTKVTLSSKILDQEREHFCDLAVKAVLRLKGSDHLDSIHIIKKSGGCLKDSFIDDGFILDKQFGIKPIVKEGKIEGDKDVNSGMTRINDARILLANTPMDYDKIKIFGARVRVDSSAKIAELEAAEKKKMKDKVDNIIKHNVNVFINRQLIYNYPEQLLSDAGVVCIEHADFEGTERLAKVLGAEIVSTFNNPSGVKIGKCKVIEEIMIGEDRLLRFSGVQAGEACTVVLRGSSEHILDEAERALHDALCVLVTVVKEPRFVYGGGCSEILMADAVQKVAQKTAGKEAMAIESFAEALRQLPHAIAENAGLDASELISKLRAMHATGNSTYGIDIVNECPGDMETLKIYESLRVKNRVLISAFEAAEMILRVDDILKCAPRKRENHPRY